MIKPEELKESKHVWLIMFLYAIKINPSFSIFGHYFLPLSRYNRIIGRMTRKLLFPKMHFEQLTSCPYGVVEEMTRRGIYNIKYEIRDCDKRLGSIIWVWFKFLQPYRRDTFLEEVLLLPFYFVGRNDLNAFRDNLSKAIKLNT